VERATSMKGVQPVLANILIESINNSTLKFTATDLDLTVVAKIDAQVKEEGKITLPAKKLSDIVSKVSEGLVEFKTDDEENKMNIKCKNAKFEILSIPAEQFPQVSEEENLETVEIDIKPFNKAVKQASFAAASYETNNILAGVVCKIENSVLEMASTDGNRLARVREKIENNVEIEQLVIPSKTLQEFSKMSSFIDEETVKISFEKSKLYLKTEKITLISRLMEGNYPKYNQLIPTESPKEAIVSVQQLISSLERVAIMVNEKTSNVKFMFTEDKLTLSADTPDSGASEDSFDIDYKGEDLLIAFNYKYVLDSLRNLETSEVKIGLNSALSATVLRPNNEEDYICLIMPLHIQN
ncbi:MAG: DNA polymerase III subunit beta, partial [bacterium]|nr:DNA polymerase III subunit beta [bacterium]